MVACTLTKHVDVYFLSIWIMLLDFIGHPYNLHYFLMQVCCTRDHLVMCAVENIPSESVSLHLRSLRRLSPVAASSTPEHVSYQFLSSALSLMLSVLMAIEP
jgi:hypothetical protein